MLREPDSATYLSRAPRIRLTGSEAEALWMISFCASDRDVSSDRDAIAATAILTDCAPKCKHAPVQKGWRFQRREPRSKSPPRTPGICSFAQGSGYTGLYTGEATRKARGVTRSGSMPGVAFQTSDGAVYHFDLYLFRDFMYYHLYKNELVLLLLPVCIACLSAV